MANNFETMMTELESIVNKLDNDKVSLEESIQLYEQGIKLSKACQQQLSEAEKKINQVSAAEVNNEA
ncbi:exodeoxyribonuclease VII small subunit [Macrococcus equipercicus]|uniref:Exodeoxyribonuclease 7 small subunit n=1 Tax=Macrococcus equipercicus TaxID=69967 RepID=A0A9Q9BRS5_9STAP|nr:exodeoxyribonuclease VII small subunit [Macrococcus equipercicus]KAA1040128.1 exodeoxyribonuclease VII small subunit [Macrococcus equipercicus]UTH12924.1 exodeoxyribonuclease VII small subunit [Macrococcus equipercicus]